MVTLYVVDPRQSHFTVQAFATGILAGFGHSPRFAIQQYEGTFNLDSASQSQSSLSLSVKAASLLLIDQVSEMERAEIHRATLDDVLEVGKYPEISFNGPDIALTQITDCWFRAQIRGDMRLHGVTKPVDIDSQLRLSDGDVRLSGGFELSLADFKIKRVKSVGGLLKVKDELKFEFDLLGHKEDPS
ncbi:MAG TPA: YceI family protein [Tepidisphaeraceae bacterium]|jgi:polyisoprenoid-binding protein YceI